MKACSALFLAGLLSLSLLAEGSPMTGGHRDLPDPDFHFNTFFVSWGGTTTPEFLDFLKATKPEIVQVGFYGPLFHGYADNPQSTGYPMQLPISGQREALETQRKVIEQIHELGLKAVAHFQMVLVHYRDDFLDFYDHHWPEDILGPKPNPDVREVLQRDAQGNIIYQERSADYPDSIDICLTSPYGRQMLKQMLKVALDAGVDGIITNYNYHFGCACPYCQAAFRKYLAERFTPKQLKERFGIEDLATYKFDRIGAHIPGYPDAATATPLDWEAMRWAALAFKKAFDEILIDYGRRLKPDLIIATWNHLGDANAAGEERGFTPIELWGKGENYFWYSGGYGPTKLAEHKAGDGWLDCLYIREMCGGKPFMLGKYEGIRMANSIAEGVATGGSGMGLQIGYHDPVGYRAGVQYLRFLRAHEKLYWPVESFAEVGLLLPRQSALNGHPEGVDAFRSVGHTLIDDHVLMDVVLDQRLTQERLARYKVVIVPVAYNLSDEQCGMFERYVRGGGTVLVLGDAARENERGGARSRPGLFGVGATPGEPLRRQLGRGRFVWLPTADAAAALPALRELGGDSLSAFEAPWTLRVSTFSQPDRLILHLVNYNRDEALGNTLSGPAAECPLAAEDIGVSLRLPEGGVMSKVVLRSPDGGGRQVLAWAVRDGRLEFRVPRVLVYGVVEIGFAGE